MRDLNEDEKRAINFAAEYGEISVSDVQRLRSGSGRPLSAYSCNSSQKKCWNIIQGRTLTATRKQDSQSGFRPPKELGCLGRSSVNLLGD
jgi:hypothetical protein